MSIQNTLKSTVLFPLFLWVVMRRTVSYMMSCSSAVFYNSSIGLGSILFYPSSVLHIFTKLIELKQKLPHPHGACILFICYLKCILCFSLPWSSDYLSEGRKEGRKKERISTGPVTAFISQKLMDEMCGWKTWEVVWCWNVFGQIIHILYFSTEHWIFGKVTSVYLIRSRKAIYVKKREKIQRRENKHHEFDQAGHEK